MQRVHLWVGSCSSWHGRFHYIFSLRDLSRVFQGICQADPQVVNNAAVLVRPNFSSKHSFSVKDSARCTLIPCKKRRRLWRNECTRVYEDRFNEDGDKAATIGCQACRRQFCHLQHAVSAARLSSVRSSSTTSSRLNLRRALGMHLARLVE